MTGVFYVRDHIGQKVYDQDVIKETKQHLIYGCDVILIDGPVAMFLYGYHYKRDDIRIGIIACYNLMEYRSMEINNDSISALIDTCFNSVKEKVENGKLLSSEKTLVFLFAMELVYRFGDKLTIDFENQCYSELKGKSKYLDLLFYTHDNFKIAIEFKLPTKSGSGNSNQTQTRESVYRDLARLNYLKTKSKLSPQSCYFIMATNENSYLNKGRYSKGIEFITGNKHSIEPSNEISAEDLSLSGINATFSWINIKMSGGKCVKAGRYAWLSPIKL